MDFGSLLNHYFGADDLEALSPEAIAPGLERMRLDLGLETDPGRRFGLWALMHMLGGAPDLDVAFEDPAEREAARNFMDLVDRVGEA